MVNAAAAGVLHEGQCGSPGKPGWAILKTPTFLPPSGCGNSRRLGKTPRAGPVRNSQAIPANFAPARASGP